MKEDENNFLFYPFLLNSINELGYELDEEFYDIQGTYGYNSPIGKAEDKKLIGITILKNINLINRVAEFAIYIGDEKERGKGYSIISTLFTLKFGFHDLGLNRIFLKVLEENKTAIKLYKKCFFTKEGLLRETVYKNNEFKNEIIMSVLKSEFKGC